jgi:hypothetical protein
MSRDASSGDKKKYGGKLLRHSVLRGGGSVSSGRIAQQKRDSLLGTWNVRSLYRTGSLTAAARELARYKLDLVGVQEVRWDKEGTERAGDYNFHYEKENETHQLGTGFYTPKNSISS